MIGKMKGYLLAAWSLLLSLGTFLLTFSLLRSGRNKRERKEAEARLRHAQDVMEQDKEIERELDVRTEELANDVEKRRAELRNPNTW